MDTVKIISNTRGPLGVTVPELNFRRRWSGMGMVHEVDKKMVEQLLFDPGFAYMIQQGMLYIEDMDAKKELGLEPADAKEPVNIIVLNDKQRRQYWVNLSQKDFENKVNELGYEEVELLADYAIANRIIDLDKCRFMQKKCGRDIIQAIRLNEANKEE